MFEIILSSWLVSLPSEEEMERSPIKISGLSELNEKEVGATAELEIDHAMTDDDFKACVPRDSIAYPKTFSDDLQSEIFTKEEARGLDECAPNDCKFNFLSPEALALKNAKDLDAKKALFKKFYDERTQGLKGVDPNRGNQFLRSKDKPFEGPCVGSDLDKLLNARPVRTMPFRLSIVKYEKRMRPTTRLLQGIYWNRNNAYCYGDALVFSDHYDIDRVQLWSAVKTDTGRILQLQFRSRIDLLNSWARRLNKEKFRREAKQIAFSEMDMVEACLKNRAKVDLPKKTK
jgi:hypothetical protein